MLLPLKIGGCQQSVVEPSNSLDYFTSPNSTILTTSTNDSAKAVQTSIFRPNSSTRTQSVLRKKKKNHIVELATPILSVQILPRPPNFFPYLLLNFVVEFQLYCITDLMVVFRSCSRISLCLLDQMSMFDVMWSWSAAEERFDCCLFENIGDVTISHTFGKPTTLGDVVRPKAKLKFVQCLDK